MKSKVIQRTGGFTLLEVMVTVGILGIALLIALPNVFKARDTAQVKICVSNLHAIDRTKQQWAVENNKATTSTPVYADLQPYLSVSAREQGCPADGSYLLRSMEFPPLCTLWRRGHIVR